MFTVNIHIKKLKYVFIWVEIVTYRTSGGAFLYDQHYEWLIVAELASIRYEVVCCLAGMLPSLLSEEEGVVEGVTISLDNIRLRIY